MSVVLIAALDRNRAIGRRNALPWQLPDDLKRFKALTGTRPLLMGRKTAESIGRSLPGRLNLVLTRRGVAPFAGQQAVNAIDAVINAHPDVCVIGGAEVYAQTLELADCLHLTWVDTEVADADTFFPAFDEREFVKTVVASVAADARHAYSFQFIDYVRAR